jgi:hypothetical protein
MTAFCLPPHGSTGLVFTSLTKKMPEAPAPPEKGGPSPDSCKNIKLFQCFPQLLH